MYEMYQKTLWLTVNDIKINEIINDNHQCMRCLEKYLLSKRVSYHSLSNLITNPMMIKLIFSANVQHKLFLKTSSMST